MAEFNEEMVDSGDFDYFVDYACSQVLPFSLGDSNSRSTCKVILIRHRGLILIRS
jgi:hypothetical protein